MRDRHGRGWRGPLVTPGPLTGRNRLVPMSRAQRFDDLVLGEVERLESRWPDELAAVDFGVEDAPEPGAVTGQPVPLAVLVPGEGIVPARIVVFRRPIERRAVGRSELGALVREVLVDQVADLLDREPDEVDPSR